MLGAIAALHAIRASEGESFNPIGYAIVMLIFVLVGIIILCSW